MPDALLSQALAQAELSEPAIKATALLHIARVLGAEDRDAAIHLLDRGLAILSSIPSNESWGLDDAVVQLSAAIDPQRMQQLLHSLSGSRIARGQMEGTLIQIMRQHGHTDQAVLLLSEPAAMPSYPFIAVNSVIHDEPDESTRLKIVRAAITAWRQLEDDHNRRRAEVHFLRIFAQNWNLLPRADALQTTREIVEHIMHAPDDPASVSIMPDRDGVEFTSNRQFQLFEILNVMRRLIPETLESLLQTHEQLARAAVRFPLGHESITAETQPTRPPDQGPAFIVGGGSVGREADDRGSQTFLPFCVRCLY